MGRTGNTKPKCQIQIEYEDDDYTYISSTYPYKALKAEIEQIKKPIIVHFTAMPTALSW